MGCGRGQGELRQIQSFIGDIINSVGVGADSQVRWNVVLGRSEIESELNFRISRSSLPASFERARGGCGGMIAGEWVSGSIERFGEIFRGEIAQMKNNDRILDCWWGSALPWRTLAHSGV